MDVAPNKLTCKNFFNIINLSLKDSTDPKGSNIWADPDNSGTTLL